MQFKIQQQDFYPLLQSVSRSCGVKAQLPVLNNVLISAAAGKVTLSATNLEVGVIKSVAAEVIEEGDITIPARTLVDVTSNLSGLLIEFSSTADQLKITAPGFSSQMNGIPASEFPAIPLASEDEVTLDAQGLVKSLPEVGFASAVDEGRPVLTGILTEIKGKKLQLVATDGYRLAHKIMDVKQEHSFKALIPRRTLEEVVRLIGEDDIDLVKVATSENRNQMIFSFGSTTLSSRLIEGQFPSWEKIIPAEIKTTLIVDRLSFLKAVKLSAVFSRLEANVVKLQNTENSLTLTSEGKELGSQKNEVPVTSEGEEMTIAFNTKFLSEALSACPGAQVKILLSGNLSAAVIKPVSEEGLQYVIMPVNLN